MARWTVEVDLCGKAGGGYRRSHCAEQADAIKAAKALMDTFGDCIYLISFYDKTGLRRGVWRSGSEEINWQMETDSQGRRCVRWESYAHLTEEEMYSGQP